MKKFLLLIAIVSTSLMATAQENPCPTVAAVRKVNRVNNGDGTCSAAIRFFLLNDISNPNPKGIQVEVFCGPVTGTPVLTQCFIAATPGSTLTTNSFTCPCSSITSVRITRFTASNGQCQGGSCATVFVVTEIPLPVDFKSFTATRNRSNVLIKWETLLESNNRGFAVEKNTGNNNWEEIAFVPTQAVGGNSSDLLSYQFVDANNYKGITQYRLRQIDIDSRIKFSEIRTVRGDGQLGNVIVYPNPSTDGKVSIVFDEREVVRDIAVADMSGRIIKQLKGVSNNSIMIDNLTPGMYSIRILSVETGEQVVEKIVVNKR